MPELSMNDKMTLVQYSIEKYENEEELLSKLSSILPEKDIQRSLDTLIGTQKVRRIGPEIIQNNTSHTELPELPNNIKELLDKIEKPLNPSGLAFSGCFVNQPIFSSMSSLSSGNVPAILYALEP